MPRFTVYLVYVWVAPSYVQVRSYDVMYIFAVSGRITSALSTVVKLNQPVRSAVGSPVFVTAGVPLKALA